jgi:SAM-dependent methyltransferase
MPNAIRLTGSVATESLSTALEQIPKEVFEGLLMSYLKHAPLSLALREINRLAVMQAELRSIGVGATDSVLDVGCGDGFWWTMIEGPKAQVYGVDIADRELALAQQHLKAVHHLDIAKSSVIADFRALAWPRAFDFVVGNCSLEHVPRLDAAIDNIARVLKPGGHFLLFVPTPTWATHGTMMKLLSERFPRVAMAIAGAMNGFFQHWHLYEDWLWQQLLENKGFTVKKVIYMGKRRSEFLFRLGLPTAFLAFLFKKSLGVYPNRFAPRWLRRITVAWVRAILTAERGTSVDEEREFAYEYAFLCERN